MSYRPNKPSQVRDYYDNMGSLSRPRYRGVGDVVAAMTRAIGVQPCSPCKKRQVWLNGVMPFRRGR